MMNLCNINRSFVSPGTYLKTCFKKVSKIKLRLNLNQVIKTTGKPIKWIISFSLVLSKVFFFDERASIKNSNIH